MPDNKKNDYMEIFYSPLGAFSQYFDKSIISIINDDGSVNFNKFEEMVKFASNSGANAMRDFYWAVNNKFSIYFGKLDAKSSESPFNENYYNCQAKMAEICNAYGIRYYITLFNECSTKKATGDFDPWSIYSDFFYGDDAKHAVSDHINNIMNSLSDFYFGVDVCNEPATGKSNFLKEATWQTWSWAEKFSKNNKSDNFSLYNIILGNDYRLKEIYPETYGKDYREVRDYLSKWFPGAESVMKSRCISPVHAASLSNILELWGTDVKTGGERRILYSMDGLINPRPSALEIEKIMDQLFDKKRKSLDKKKVLIEIVLGKTSADTINVMPGVIDVIAKKTNTMPKNCGVYPVGINFPYIEPVLEEVIEIEKKEDEKNYDLKHTNITPIKRSGFWQSIINFFKSIF